MENFRSAPLARTLAVIAFLLSGHAFATPVTIYNPGWQFDFNWSAVVRLEADEYGPAAYSYSQSGQGSGSSAGYASTVTDPYGTASASASAQMQTYISNSDTSASLQATTTLNAAASLTGYLPKGSAVADASLWLFGVSFDVLEPVLYSGSSTLFGSDGEFASGTILQPGFYSNLLQHAAWVGTGYLDEPGSVSNSLTKTFAYNFTSVPAPSPAPLILLGLMAMAWGRRWLNVRAWTTLNST